MSFANVKLYLSVKNLIYSLLCSLQIYMPNIIVHIVKKKLVECE